MQAAQRVAKNTIILYARMAITMFISLYSTRLVLAALGASDFGLLNLVGGVISMLGFLNASMAAATQRFISFAQGEGDFEKVKRIFNMSSLLHWGIALVIFFVLELAGYFIFNGVLNIAPDRIGVAKVIYQFMIVSTLFTVISVPYEAVITSHENMMVYAILGIVESLLKLVIAIYISYASYDHLTLYGLLIAIISILLLVIRRIYCHKKYEECKLNIKENYDRKLLGEIGVFAGWSFLGSSSSMITTYGLGVVMNMFFGTIINAAQGIANQVSGQLVTFSLTMQKALFPVLTKSAGGGDVNFMMKASITGAKAGFFLVLFFSVPVIVEMPYIFGVWLKYIPPYTIIFCRLLLIKILIEQFYTSLTPTLSAIGKIKKLEIATSILNCLPLIFTYYFFKLNYGPVSAYYIFIVYICLFCTIVIYFANQYLSLSYENYFKHLILPCIGSVLLLLLLAYLPSYFIQPTLTRLTLVFIINFIGSFIILKYWVLSKIEIDKFDLLIKLKKIV